MGYLEENLSVIEKVRPNLYKEVKKIIDEKKNLYDNIEEIDTKDGNKALVVNKDNNKYRLNSIYRPVSEAEKWADQYEFYSINISVLMFGMGNLLFVREMLRRLQSDAKVYLYEPDIAVFLYDIYNLDIVDILKDDRVDLFVNDINQREFKDIVRDEIDWSMLPTQIVCNHPVYDKIYEDEYEEFLKWVQDINNLEKINRDTEKYMSAWFTTNVIKNLKYVKESNYVSEFVGKIPEDVPAIIVAAGPSLDKNIDELKKAEGKAFIFATDTSIKYLLAHNIKFDAFITLDAKKTIDHFQDERCYNVPMFCVIESRNALLELHTGRKIWFRGSVYMYDLYSRFNREFPTYNSGGSVATAAFSVCVSMGIKNIVLIGQDLAYSGGVTHAGGIVKDISGDEAGREMVESVDGGMVETRYDWLIYLEWLENSIRDLKEFNVIDATEGGALIHGSKVMKLSETIDKYCKKDFSFESLLKDMPYTFNEEEYPEVKEKMLHLRKEFVNIKQKSKEGIKAVGELKKVVNAGKYNTKTEAKNLKIINKINNFLGKQDAYNILDVYITGIISEDVSMINSLTEDKDENMRKTLEISEAVYKALIQAVDDMTPALEETLAVL